MSTETGIHHHARAEIQSSTISSRLIGLGRGPYARLHHVLIVSDGSIRIPVSGDDARRLRGPALVYLPPSSVSGLTIEAGTQGALIGASPEIMADATGNKAESYALRIFAERPFLGDRIDESALGEIYPLVMGFVRELADRDRESWMVISAYMRLVLMAMWRISASEPAEQRGRGDVASILQRYRQFVEVHFRSHRPIRDYALELGISTDRLHAICQRTLGRSPIQLLHERLIQEARLRLERSAGTIQQISDELGFRDPTYFSHFFKRKTAHSPATYRSLTRNLGGKQDPPPSSSYADWP